MQSMCEVISSTLFATGTWTSTREKDFIQMPIVSSKIQVRTSHPGTELLIPNHWKTTKAAETTSVQPWNHLFSGGSISFSGFPRQLK